MISLRACCRGLTWVSCIAWVCGRAINTNQETFTVKLRRQIIPLHSSGGVVHHRSAYYGSITLGGPSTQLFEVVFDTGSGHLVLPSAWCQSETCRAHRRYKRRQSQLAQDIEVDGTPVTPGQGRDQITVSFGTGEVTGVFVHEYVCLGSVDEVPSDTSITPSLLQVTTSRQHKSEVSEEDAALRPRVHGCVEMRIVSAIAMTDDPFANFAFDGVLGLGLHALSQTPEFNFMGEAASRRAWTGSTAGLSHTFAVFLATSEDEESEITFGGWQPSHIVEGHELAWCAVQDAQAGYWQIDILEIRANGVKLEFCDGPVMCRAIVDTGTSLLAVPSALGPTLVDHLRHDASGVTGGCDGAGPRLEIDLETFTIALDPVDYARPEYIAEGDGSAAAGDVDAQGEDEFGAAVDNSCVPMLMHIDLGEPLGPKTLLLGEPVLQRYYTAFDSLGLRVGFAEAVHVSPKMTMVTGRSIV